jgi:molybdopterin molybdotransferase
VAQLSDDCFAFGGELMSSAAALALLKQKLAPVTEAERVALKDAAGRVLAEKLVATRDVPPADNVAVDGYAVRFADLVPGGETVLPIMGRAAAGHPLRDAAPAQSAIRVFTGALLPQDTDTVLMQEDCKVVNGAVTIPAGIKRGANCREAGEDIKAGTLVLAAGRRLRAQEIGLAASLGLTSLLVYRPLRVALFSTGDELREPGDGLSLGAIYDANRYTLQALLQGLGAQISDLGILADKPETVRAALAEAAQHHDLVLTSGGMSTGEEDHVKAAVEALGKLHFWRLAIKPGRPVAMGQIGRVPFVGLPGNPVAVMVSFLAFVRPALLRMMGCHETACAPPPLLRATSVGAIRKKPGRTEYQRGRVETLAGAMPEVRIAGNQGSGVLSSMVEANGLVVLHHDQGSVAAGDTVDVMMFDSVV